MLIDKRTVEKRLYKHRNIPTCVKCKKQNCIKTVSGSLQYFIPYYIWQLQEIHGNVNTFLIKSNCAFF